MPFVDKIVNDVPAAGQSWKLQKPWGEIIYRYTDFDSFLDSLDFLHQTVDTINQGSTTGTIYAFYFPPNITANTFGGTILVATNAGRRLAVADYGVPQPQSPSLTRWIANVSTVKGERKEWPMYVAMPLKPTGALYP